MRTLKEFCTQRGLWCPEPEPPPAAARGEANPSDSSDEWQPPVEILQQGEMIEIRGEHSGKRVDDRLLARRKRKL